METISSRGRKHCRIYPLNRKSFGDETLPTRYSHAQYFSERYCMVLKTSS